MTCNVLMGTLNPAHSFIHSMIPIRLGQTSCDIGSWRN